MSKNNRNKRSTTTVALAVILLLFGLFAIGGSYWMQENEISQGAQEYENMTLELKQPSEDSKAETGVMDVPVEDDQTVTDTPDQDSESIEDATEQIESGEEPAADIENEADGDAQQDEQELSERENTDLKEAVTVPAESDQSTDKVPVVDKPVVQPGQGASSGNTGADLNACKAINKDFIGWLQIPGTDVDYPVVLTNDVDYYLDHTFNGKESIIGCLFSLGKSDYQTPSQNIAVYGHHMRRSRATTMFQPLHNYKDSGFCASHKTINYDTLYGADTYTVFAVINKRECDWDVSTADFASDADFQAFINRAMEWSIYDTGVTVTTDDHILTLVTCDRDYNAEDGQLVIMAVKD